MNKLLKNIIIFVVVISLGYYFWSIIDRAITGKAVTNTLKSKRKLRPYIFSSLI